MTDLTQSSPPAPAARVLRNAGLSVVVEPRAVLVTIALLGLAVAVVLLTLGTGALPATPVEVVNALLGRADGGVAFVVLDLGMPRALTGLLVGGGLGVAGALVQALTRNPLGSPDVIGFDSGAAFGALVGILVLGLGPSAYAVLAVGVGAATAAVVFLLSSGGHDTSYRIILIGIGAGALLDAANAYLLTRSTATESLSAVRWLVGSLNAATWSDVRLATVATLVLLPGALVAARHLRVMMLGPDVAAALGVRVTAVSALTLLLAVAYSATAVLAAGPISFIALAAPQLAQRLAGGQRAPRIISSAAMGAFLLTTSDLIAQRALGSTDLPVGVVTGAVGGIYLAWVLAREWRGRTP